MNILWPIIPFLLGYLVIIMESIECNNNVKFVCSFRRLCIMKNIYYCIYIEKRIGVCIYACVMIWQGRDLIFDLSTISYVLRYIYSFFSVYIQTVLFTLYDVKVFEIYDFVGCVKLYKTVIFNVTYYPRNHMIGDARCWIGLLYHYSMNIQKFILNSNKNETKQRISQTHIDNFFTVKPFYHGFMLEEAKPRRRSQRLYLNLHLLLTTNTYVRIILDEKCHFK